jgi:hypothetical protein
VKGLLHGPSFSARDAHLQGFREARSSPLLALVGSVARSLAQRSPRGPRNVAVTSAKLPHSQRSVSRSGPGGELAIGDDRQVSPRRWLWIHLDAPFDVARRRRGWDQAHHRRVGRTGRSCRPLHGGAVITGAGTDPNVAALVYIAAFAADEGSR